MPAKKHSLVGKQRGSLHKSSAKSNGRSIKGAIIGFSVGGALLVGASIGAVVGAYVSFSPIGVKLRNATPDGESNIKTTTKIDLEFDTDMSDDFQYNCVQMLLGSTMYHPIVEHTFGSEYVIHFDGHWEWIDGEQACLYFFSPRDSKYKFTDDPSRVIQLWRAKTPVNLVSAEASGAKFTETTEFITLRFDQDMGNVIDGWNVHLSLNERQPHDPDLSVNHVSHWGWCEYRVYLNDGYWLEGALATVTIQQDPDQYHIVTPTIDNVELHRSSTKFLAVKASGEAHNVTSDYIVLVFDEWMGTAFNKDNVDFEWTEESSQFQLPYIKEVSESSDPDYSGHTVYKVSFDTDGSPASWTEDAGLDVIVTPPTGFTFDRTTLSVHLHKADTWVKLEGATADGYKDRSLTKEITLTFNQDMGTAFNKDCLSFENFDGDPNKEPKVGEVQRDGDKKYTVALDGGDWNEGNTIGIAITQQPEGYQIHDYIENIELHKPNAVGALNINGSNWGTSVAGTFASGEDYTIDDDNFTVTYAHTTDKKDAYYAKDLTVPAKVIKGDTVYDVNIGWQAFYSKEIVLEGKLTLSEGITKIDSGAFAHKDRLTELNFPTSLTDIGNSAFSECNGLKNINAKFEVTPKIGTSSFSIISLSPGTVTNTSSSAYSSVDLLRDLKKFGSLPDNWVS